MKGAAIMRDFEPDWIVAMGGGSPIDAAKAMWIFSLLMFLILLNFPFHDKYLLVM